MTATAEFNKTRAAFMKRASAPRVTPFALKLAYVICFQYMNRQTQTAFVAQETLARDLDVTTRTIRTLLDVLEPLGLVIAPGHGPNRASTYWLDPDRATRVPPPMTADNRKPASASNRKPASASAPNTGKLAHDNRKTDDTNTGSQLPPYLTKRPRRDQGKKDSLRAGALESEKNAPDFASLGKGRKRRQAGTGEASKAQALPEPPPETADAFARFWAAYPRHDAELPARKAFARAIVDTDPEAVIAGAQRYAVAEQLRLARPDQTPQHTLMAKNWLRERRWNDPPPPGAMIDESGAIVGFERQDDDEQSFEDVLAAMLVEAEEKDRQESEALQREYRERVAAYQRRQREQAR